MNGRDKNANRRYLAALTQAVHALAAE